MRIGIDARLAIREGATGIPAVITHLVNFMAKEDPDSTFFLFYPSLFSKKHISGLIKRDNVVPVRIPLSEALRYSTFLFLWYEMLLPLWIKYKKIDIFHGQAYHLPATKHIKKVLTIHHLWDNEFGYGGFPDEKTFLKHIARADALIAVSEATRQTTLKKFSLDAHTIQTIYSGIQTTSQIDVSDKKLQNFKKLHNLDYPYIIFVGSFFPRKNVTGILKAFSIFKQRYAQNHKLILVGKEFYPQPRTLAEELHLGNDTIFWGYASEVDLACLYALSEFLVFPSFEEGFGFPILEAFWHNKPAVVSDIPCFREVLDDAAIFVDPHSPESICDGMQKLAFSERLREELVTKGQALLNRYSWSEAAKKTLMLYKSLK